MSNAYNPPPLRKGWKIRAEKRPPATARGPQRAGGDALAVNRVRWPLSVWRVARYAVANVNGLLHNMKLLLLTTTTTSGSRVFGIFSWLLEMELDYRRDDKCYRKVSPYM